MLFFSTSQPNVKRQFFEVLVRPGLDPPVRLVEPDRSVLTSRLGNETPRNPNAKDVRRDIARAKSHSKTKEAPSVRTGVYVANHRTSKHLNPRHLKTEVCGHNTDCKTKKSNQIHFFLRGLVDGSSGENCLNHPTGDQ